MALLCPFLFLPPTMGATFSNLGNFAFSRLKKISLPWEKTFFYYVFSLRWEHV